MRTKLIAAWTCVSVLITCAVVTNAKDNPDRQAGVTPKVADAIQPTVPNRVGGILGERLDLWRRVRLWRVVNDPFLLDGFLKPPGTHPWQGEHAGKWLHAASLASGATGDAKLDGQVRAVVAKLIASQQNNGYIGTYAPSERYYAKVATGDPTTWDVWTQRYAIYGLLAYCELHDDPAAAKACERAGELLMQTVGPPSGDVTRFGTRSGLSAAVILESVVMLYRQTGDSRYLEFAKHIVRSIEQNPHLRIMDAMRAGEDVTVSGDGKAYQLMAVLLGYVDLYRATGEKEYLDTAVKAWQRILAEHVNVAGGPWSYQVKRTTNQECFAPVEFFHPTNCIETCSTTTWIQLCLSLFDLTGEARFADAAEVSILNQLIGAQSPNGKDWAYHSMLNMPERGYDDAITCCASSGPRALELYARHLICVAKDRMAVNSYLPGVVPLDGLVGPSGRVAIEGHYPFVPECEMRFELERPAKFAADFRLPARATGMELKVNGDVVQTKRTPSGFFRVQREWQPNDRVALKFEFPLQAHFQTASDGVRWVAFSWGPLALSQSVVLQTEHPVSVLIVPAETEDGETFLDPEPTIGKAAMPEDNATEELDTSAVSEPAPALATMPAWRLKTARKVVLVPYFQAGAKGGGVRTMFPTRKEPLEQ